jgi:outer membrane lipoprotein SlyB
MYGHEFNQRGGTAAMKKLLVATLGALLVSFAANAESINTLTISEHQRTSDQQLSDSLVEVHSHRNPGAVIATDALYGGLAGLAIGGGVALITSDSNWGRDLAIGAGIGLVAGGIYGAVDAASYDRVPVGFGNSYKVVNRTF